MSKVLSAQDVANLLRTRKELVLKMLDQGEIPAVRIGNNWKVDEDQLHEWFTSKASKEARARRELNND